MSLDSERLNTEPRARHIAHRLTPSAVTQLSRGAESWTIQLRWFAAATIVGFAVPFIGSSILGLQHDVYLGIYFVVVLAGFSAYARATSLPLRAALRRHWKSGVALGIVTGFVLVQNVFSDKATPHPHGGYYIFELIWRGGIYGAVDALLLTVMPCLVAYRGLGGHIVTVAQRARYFVVALALIVTVTAIYHLGFEQYRHDGLREPETGNTLISLPMLLSTNPIGSLADHMAMHVSAVAHTYNTEVRLPPPTKAR